MRPRSTWLIGLMALLIVTATPGQDVGKRLYTERCFWCHGEQGDGDGPSAVGMFPRPRDFVLADYKIRSTRHGQLPTDEDLFNVISKGLPGTPMPGWEKILSESDRRELVKYLKSFSPRFASEKLEPLGFPSSAASVERGEKLFLEARCNMCHGEEGRGDGAITATVNYQWGLPHNARDFTRGWAFKGGHEVRDIYLRITGGLNGTPMGPYELTHTDQERLDLAHYVASLDTEPSSSNAEFLVAATFTEEDIPTSHESPAWSDARVLQVPLAGQIVLDPPLRWWIPSVATTTVRALWNGREMGLLMEWNDPTGPLDPCPDSAMLQFASDASTKPYFLFGDRDHSVKVWHWQAGTSPESWLASGSDKIDIAPAEFEAHPAWKNGRWHVVFKRMMPGEPEFKSGEFVPVLFSVRDGANGERDNVRAVSTWLFVSPIPPPSARPWLLGLVYALGAALALCLLIWRLRR